MTDFIAGVDGQASEATEETTMTLDAMLNAEQIKPTVFAGGKVGFYRFGKEAFSVEKSKEIEDKFNIFDMYVAQSPLTSEMNNLVVWVSSSEETIFFDKHTQKWAVA